MESARGLVARDRRNNTYGGSAVNISSSSDRYISPHQQQKPSLTADQVREVEDAFNTFDMDNDKHLHVHELKVAMRALGFDVKLPNAMELIKSHGDGKRISFKAFMDIMQDRIASRDPMEEIRRAFALFDVDADGKIGKEDLLKVAKELHESIDETELIAMIEEFDRDGDGKIDFEDFVTIMSDEN